MKLQGTGNRSGRNVNPFGALTKANTQPVGPGVAVPRRRPGVGKPESFKRVRPFSQALGDTPIRDGPFAPMARGVYRAAPPHSRVMQYKRKSAGLSPFEPMGGV